MTRVPFIILCVAVIVVGAHLGKPGGWIVLALAVLALLLVAAGWPHW